MLKAFERMLCPVLAIVLSGMIGCKPEKTEFDIYNPPAPRVVRGADVGRVVTMAEWDKSDSRVLDLQDGFDLAEAKAASASITTRCSFSEETRTTTTEFANPGQVRIFQLLPQALLNRDPALINLKCAFAFTFTNAFGSRHILHIQEAPIRDNGSGEVAIDDKFRVRFSNQNEAHAQVFCTHLYGETVYFNQMLDLDAFNLEEYTVREEFDLDALYENALQTCRVAIYENGRLSHISGKFKHLFDRPEMVLTTTWQISTDTAFYEPLEIDRNFEFLSKRMPRHLKDIRLVNPSNATRRIRVPKALMPAVYEFFGFANTTFYITQVSKTGIYLNLGEATDVGVSEGEDSWLLTFRAQGSIILSMYVNSPMLACTGIGQEKGTLIAPAEPIRIQEVNSSGEVMSEISFGLDGRAIITTERAFKNGPTNPEIVAPSCVEI